MLVKGQGTEINLIEAYAWSKVSESNPEYKALTNTIENDLTDEQLLNANKLYEQYYAQYSMKNSKVILGPIVENKNHKTKSEGDDSSQQIKIVSGKKTPPVYPRAMQMKNQQGWVDLSFRIYPDGSVRDIYIIEEVPPNSFAKSAIKAVEKYRYSFEKNGQETPVKEPIHATLRVQYLLNKSSEGLSKEQHKFLDDLIEKANKGDIDAQYNYAFLYDTYLNKEGKVDGEQINQWLFNSAIEGITGAQYRLGQNIYYGNDCKVEKQKGLDWIMQAAQIGNAKAQYMAYNMLTSKDIVNQTDSSPFYWLQQSAGPHRDHYKD